MNAYMTPDALSEIRAASNRLRYELNARRRQRARPADFERHLTDEQRHERAQQEARMRAGALRRLPTAFGGLDG